MGEQSNAKPVSETPTCTDDGRLQSGRLAGLSMRQAIWVLSWPVLIESFLNALVGFTDTVLAAQLPNGEPATSAIGGGSYISWFMGLIIMALGVGATALVSRSMGARKLAVANAALGQTMLLAAVMGVITAIGIGFAAPYVGGWMNLSDEAQPLFAEYMVLIAAGAPFATILFSGIACARGAGDSVRPMLAMAAVNVVNVLASWTLAGSTVRIGIFEFEPPLDIHLGVQGIAAGTLIAHCVGALLILSMAMSGVWGIRLKKRWIKPHLVTLWRLVRVGVPNFCETSGMWICNFLIILMVGAMAIDGQELIGAHIVAVRAESFSFMPGFAMGSAAATLAGQYLGARRPDLAKLAVLKCAVLGALVMSAIGATFVFIPERVVGLMSQQPLHLEVAPKLIFLAGLIQVPFAIAIVIRSALRGAGDVRVVFFVTWGTSYLLRIPGAYILSGVDLPMPEFLGGGVLENPFGFSGGIVWLWAALCGEIVIRCVIFIARFMHGGWARVRV